MKTLKIILIAVTLVALSLSACSGNVKEWQKLFFASPTPVSQTTAAPAVPPGDVTWEVIPQNDVFLPIVNQDQGGEP